MHILVYLDTSLVKIRLMPHSRFFRLFHEVAAMLPSSLPHFSSLIFFIGDLFSRPRKLVLLWADRILYRENGREEGGVRHREKKDSAKKERCNERIKVSKKENRASNIKRKSL